MRSKVGSETEAPSDDPFYTVAGDTIHGSYIPSDTGTGGSSSAAQGVASSSGSLPGSVVAETSGGITINVLFDAAAMAAPASFRAGIAQAAAMLASTISDKITVNLNIDYSGTGGGAAAGPDSGLFESYSSIRSDLINGATAGDTTFNALPSGSSVQGQSNVAVWNAQLKLWGLLGANDTTTDDGSATFATDINPNLLVGVALHELTHALGRVPYGPQPDILDLFRFTSPGARLFQGTATAPAAYFSVNGGTTKLADFGQTSDSSDFLNSGVQGSNDPFNEFYNGSTIQALTTVDKQILDAIGFHTMVPAPTLGVQSSSSATAGQHIALSSLVTITDPDHTGYQTLQLWDSNGTVAGGQFVVNGVAQSGGHEIDVAPANVAGTTFDAGAAGGTDTLWAQLQFNDGRLSGWKQFSVSVPQPTLAVQSDGSATAGQHIALSSLVTITDPGNTGYQKLELWDSNGTVAGGQFVVNGVAQTGGHEIDVAPGNVAGTTFDAGTTGGTDTLWAQLQYNDGSLSGWKQFSVSAPQSMLTVQSTAGATSGQHIALSSLVTITDPNHIGYQTLELWDSNGTVAGGQFVVNGVAQTGGHEIDVAPGSVAGTNFNVGTGGGTDALWAQLQYNDGSLSGWKQFSVGVPQPTLAVQSDGSATAGQHIALSSLVTITDPGNTGYQKLELWDSNGTVAGGQFVVNGVAQTGGHEIDVAPGNVAGTTFDAGTTGGTDTLWAQLQYNDGSLSGWKQFSVSAPQSMLTVQSTAGATSGQHIALSSLVTITDPNHIGYQTLELWDSNGTVAGGQFVVNGVAQTGGHEIDVAPGSVAGTNFNVGTGGGTDALWAQLQYNDGSLSGWKQFSVGVPQPTLAVQNDGSATAGQHIALSSLVTITDPGNTGYQKLELWDSNGTVAGGQFVVNGVAQTGGHEIDVAPGNVAGTTFDAGTTGGTDTLWAQLQYNDGSLSGWKQFSVSAPLSTQPVAQNPSTAAAAGMDAFVFRQEATADAAHNVASEPADLSFVLADAGTSLKKALADFSADHAAAPGVEVADMHDAVLLQHGSGFFLH